MAKLKIAVIIGSNRRHSINRKLAQALTKRRQVRSVPLSLNNTCGKFSAFWVSW